MPPAPACPAVLVYGCGFTPAPPAGTGQHSQGHLHCSTHLTFLASQLPPSLCFTCSFFPADICLLIVFPCHTGFLQAFPQWQSPGVLLLSLGEAHGCWSEMFLTPRAVWCPLPLWLLPQAYRELSRGSASFSGVACLGCYRLVTAVWGLAGNGSDQTRVAHIYSHLSISKLGEPVVNVEEK